jgi:hypothetical protein
VCILFFQPLVLDPELSTLDFEEKEVGSRCFFAFSVRDRAVKVRMRWRSLVGEERRLGRAICHGEERRFEQGEERRQGFCGDRW